MEIRELKQLADLYGFIVKPEKSNGKLVFNKFFSNDTVQISLGAIVWNIKEYTKYKRYTATTNISINNLQNLNYKKLKLILLEDIYTQVIKNNILMI